MKIKVSFIVSIIFFIIYIVFVILNSDRINSKYNNEINVTVDDECSSKLVGSSFVTLRVICYKFPDEVYNAESNPKANAWHFDFINDLDSRGRNFLLISPSGKLTRFKIESGYIQHKDVGNVKNIFSNQDNGFGVKDIASTQVVNEYLISYTSINEVLNCTNLKLDLIKLDLYKNEIILQENLFTTMPCLELPAGGSQAGGRILIDNDQILLTTGDFAVSQSEPQSLTTDYGKILILNKTNKNFKKILSLGHRNPQGFIKLNSGQYLSSEHGPSGGDEINLILQGQNYGWPEVSLGYHYAVSGFPNTENNHSNFEPPIYAFTPSIGIGALLQIDSRKFGKVWTTDFGNEENILVVGMRAKKLYRIELRESNSKVTVVEPIDLNKRVRDIKKSINGEIFALTDDFQMLEIKKENILR